MHRSTWKRACKHIILPERTAWSQQNISAGKQFSLVQQHILQNKQVCAKKSTLINSHSIALSIAWGKTSSFASLCMYGKKTHISWVCHLLFYCVCFNALLCAASYIPSKYIAAKAVWGSANIVRPEQYYPLSITRAHPVHTPLSLFHTFFLTHPRLLHMWPMF